MVFRLIAIGLLTLASWGQGADPARFATAIAAFEAQDKTAPPAKGGILFIGSSIFRQWTNVAEQMAPLPVFNRAFGDRRPTTFCTTWTAWCCRMSRR